MLYYVALEYDDQSSHVIGFLNADSVEEVAQKLKLGKRLGDPAFHLEFPHFGDFECPDDVVDQGSVEHISVYQLHKIESAQEISDACEN